MIIIYTGNGKGKTSACVGQAIRALAHGKNVAFGQFFKLPEQAGEQKLLKELLQENFRAAGPGFYFGGRDDFALHRSHVQALFAWAEEISRRCFMLVLDEALYALGAGLLQEQELHKLIRLCREQGTHLVLSGRGLPQWLADEADLISEIMVRKHPISSGQKAQVGIEF